MVGPRAQRLYEEKKARGEIPIKPLPDDVNCDLDRAPTAGRPAPKPSDLVIGTLALVPPAFVAFAPRASRLAHRHTTVGAGCQESGRSLPPKPQ